MLNIGHMLICMQFFHLSRSQSLGGMGRMGGMQGRGMMGGLSGLGGNRNLRLPPGFANIRGEIVDARNKLIQRITQRGTNYYSYESQFNTNQDSIPIFQRLEKDIGQRFIIFPDRNYPKGDGHYIVLRKMFGAMAGGQIPQAIYEAFQMSLGDSISGLVMNFDKDLYLQNRQNTMMGTGGYGGHTGTSYGAIGGSYPRLKRKDSSGEAGEVKLVPMEFSSNTDTDKKSQSHDEQENS